MATEIILDDEKPLCPICLGLLHVPRQLPCAHTFCHNCLQSYIKGTFANNEKRRYIECLICRKRAGFFRHNTTISEWVSLLPADTVLQSILPSKSRGDRMCDACKSEGIHVIAAGFCAVCKESMCDVCLKVHRKQKMTKAHEILINEELWKNPHSVMKFAEGFTCVHHHGENLKFYCKNHTVACCGICFFESHKTCSNVKMLKEDLPALLRESNPSLIIEQLKNIETHLKKFMDQNESGVYDLESQVKKLTDQINELRNKINETLDDLEIRVKAEGSRIYNDVVVRKEEEKRQCMSQIQAVRNSRVLFEKVHAYGFDIQKFLIAEKIKSQLPCYYNQIRDKYERTEVVTLRVEFASLVETLLSFSSDIGNFMTMTCSTFPVLGVRKPTKSCRIHSADAFNINVDDKYESRYSGVTVLPKDRVILVDHSNRQCILLNDSHEIVTSYELTGRPCDTCIFDDQEVAISFRELKKIQILSVRDDVICPVRTIPTKHKCYGIAAAGKREIVVAGECGKNRYCWSLISGGREVKASNEYYSPSGSVNYIILNNSKARVYVSVLETNSVHCFYMTGKKQYTYSSDNLISPMGVAVDRDDNIYVVGCNSHNIHQLSPDGFIIGVIITGVPRFPRAICFDNNRDVFIITNDSVTKRLHIFQLK